LARLPGRSGWQAPGSAGLGLTRANHAPPFLLQVRAQLTAAAGLVNELERRAMRLKLDLAQQQRRGELVQLLRVMLPLLQQLQAIKVRASQPA
jgi:hydroxypyruvate isomerase